MITRSKNNIFRPKQIHSITTHHPTPSSAEPTCVSQALNIPHWCRVMDDEINVLLHNQTWDIVPPLSSTNLVGCKWVFRVKRNPDSSISRYKARLVAKGFHQCPGIDFHETFSPLVKPATIRIFLTLALHYSWPIHQLDVNNVFLHRTLPDAVYMTQPPGFRDPQYPDHVCLLRKALYGLRQAPREWYNALKSFLLEYGFTTSQSDTSLFLYHRSEVTLYFLVYVDDLLVTGNNSSTIAAFITAISTRFSVKNLGALHYLLVVEVVRSSDSVFLSQYKYVYDLLTKTGMLGAKGVSTLLSSSESLRLDDGSLFTDDQTYRQIVGALQYLSLTRPDIAFVVGKLSQFMHCPSSVHLTSVKRVLRYLKQTVFHGLLLRKSNSLPLMAFSDSDWAGNYDDRTLTSAFIIYLGRCPISWSSK